MTGAKQRAIRDYFDGAAGHYASQYAQHSPTGYALHSRMQRVLELFDRPGGRVLDAGCGPGVMAGLLAESGCAVVGVDLAWGMIALAHQRYPDASFGVSDIAGLPFAERSFDAVLAMGVIEYALEEPVALLELARVVRPSGSLIVSFPNGRSPYARWRGQVYYRAVGYARPVLNRLTGRGSVGLSASLHRGYTEASIVPWFTAAGCVLEECAYYNFQVLLSPLDALLAPASVPLARALDRLARGRLRWLGSGMVVRARRV